MSKIDEYSEFMEFNPVTPDIMVIIINSLQSLQTKYNTIQIVLKTKIMQDYNLFPRRTGRQNGAEQGWQSISFVTNFYKIKLNTPAKLYQYSITLPESVPQDSDVYHQAVKKNKRELGQKIGYLTHKGQMLWGTKQETIIVIPTEVNQVKMELQIRKTKDLNLNDLNQKQTQPQLLQILNIVVKQGLRQSKYQQLGRSNKYFRPNDMQAQQQKAINDIGLEVLRGYNLTVLQLNRSICLQVDVCSRVIQSLTVAESMKKMKSKQQQIQAAFTGATVITRYGKHRTFKIFSVDYSKSPTSTFYHQKAQKEMSYIEYFQKYYNVNLKKISNIEKQPLLKVEGRKKLSLKNGKFIEQKQDFIYLIPSLVSLTGMTAEHKKGHRTMQMLAPYTKLSPTQRMDECDHLVQNLQVPMLDLSKKDNMKLKGFSLKQPQINFLNTTIRPKNNGTFQNRQLAKESFKFNDWVFVYSIGGSQHQAKRDRSDADAAIDCLTRAGKTYGIHLNLPGFIQVTESKSEGWERALQKDIDKNGQPNIIVLFVREDQQQLYQYLKRFITNTLKCPSQFIRKRTLINPKGAMSAASKICIQMNAKAGSIPWSVQVKHEYFKKKNVMYGAFSLSKGPKGFTLAFVGTTSADYTGIHWKQKLGIQSKQQITVQDYELILVEWIKKYVKKNKKTPDSIIIYREGLSEVQAYDQLKRSQIPAIENMVKTAGISLKMKNYSPEIMIVVVNKKVNFRYFHDDNRGNLFNPDSGSVMIEAVTDNQFGFYLAAQLVTQGTCNPTLFKVAYSTSSLSLQGLIQFTFSQCFNYYNWEGAVRVPACLQYANKLSKFAGEVIGVQIEKSALSSKYTFL